MKKRKTPFALITILAIGLAVVVFVSIGNFNNVGTPEELAKRASEKQVEQAVGESRQTPTKEQMSQQMKSTMSKTPTPSPINPPGGMTGKPGSPSHTVVIQNYKQRKPEPSDSSIGGHWYDEESNKEIPKKKK